MPLKFRCHGWLSLAPRGRVANCNWHDTAGADFHIRGPLRGGALLGPTEPHTGKAVDFSLPPAIRRHERTPLTPTGCTLIGSACRRPPASPVSPCSLAAPPPLLSRGRRGAARRW
eukprot:scaffold47603_cov68-Phaeocystis_antarctica.AAC.3